MARFHTASVLVAALATVACGGTASTPASATDSGTGTDTATDGPAATDATPTTDAAPPADTGTDAGPPPSTPITAPSETWTWVPFANAQCGNGSPTGIGVNLTTRSSRVLIYLEGGGACWSGTTCFVLHTAANLANGYGASNFATESTSTNYLAQPGGMFDRTSMANPFRDYSYVYVPYCTGDVHAGSTTQTYGTAHTAYHMGYANMGAFLARVVPTFPSAERVYIAGSSAGGFGALFNWYRTQQAFGSIRVDLIDDSGTPMPSDVLPAGGGNIGTAVQSWGIADNLPAGCTDCAANLDHAVGWLAAQFPAHRGALLQYQQDTVLPGYFGVMPAQFLTGLNEVLAAQFTPHSNLHAFIDPGMNHVLWFSPTRAVGGTTVQQFLTRMVTDDPAWTTVSP